MQRGSEFFIVEVRELGGVTQTCIKARNLFWPAQHEELHKCGMVKMFWMLYCTKQMNKQEH